MSDPTVPGAPTIDSVQPGDKSLLIAFTVADDGGSPVTSVTVRTNQDQSVDTLDSPVELLGVLNGEPYTVAAYATNEVGDGPLSAWSAEVVPRTVPGPPSFLTATTDDGQTEVSFAPPTDNGGDPVGSYTVTLTAQGASEPPHVALGPGSPLTVTGLTNGVTYTVVITAENGAGTSPGSLPAVTITPEAPPSPGPWQPFPDAARFDVNKEINQAQLEEELTEALGGPVQISVTRTDPTSLVGYLWVVPSTVDTEIVQQVLDAHVADPNWGVPTSVRDYLALVQRVIQDPATTLTDDEMQTLVKGLVARVNAMTT
jgi:hypothetical protein